MGCYIITAPAAVLEELPAPGVKTAAELSLNVVKAFRADAVSVGLTLRSWLRVLPRGRFNSRRVCWPVGGASCRNENGGLYLGVCDDLMHQAQIGPERPGAKGLLHNG